MVDMPRIWVMVPPRWGGLERFGVYLRMYLGFRARVLGVLGLRLKAD